MMWRHGRLFWPRFFRRDCGFWKEWMRPVLPIFAVAWLLTAQGCSSLSSTRPLPTLPVLTSLQRMELNKTPGLWMSSDDAGRLSLWIFQITGESGSWSTGAENTAK